MTATRPLGGGGGLRVPDAPPPPPARSRGGLGPGDSVAGYELVQRVKSGGMGSLWIGRRSGVGGFAKHVAIKVIHPHLGDNEDFVRMFLDEARLTARIAHPNVIQVFDVGLDDGVYFMVMELVPGCSLADVTRVVGERGRRLRPELAIAIVRELTLGLHAAHELRGETGVPLGLVHRDVSPDNVLLGTHGAVKLIDFGIAKAAERLHETRQPTLKGKLRYLAPEQLSGTVDRRTDVFALGVVLWELLAGQRLYEGASDAEILDRVRDPALPPPSSLVPEAGPAMDRLVASLTAAHPDARPATAADAARLVLQALPSSGALGAPPIAQLALATAATGAGVGTSLEPPMPAPPIEALTAERAPQSALTTGRIVLPRGAAHPAPSRAPLVVAAIGLTVIVVLALVIAFYPPTTPPEMRAHALPVVTSTTTPGRPTTPTAPPPVAAHAPIFPLPTPPAHVESAIPAPPPRAAAEPMEAAPTREASTPATTHRAPARREGRATVVDGTTLAHEL